MHKKRLNKNAEAFLINIVVLYFLTTIRFVTNTLSLAN